MITNMKCLLAMLLANEQDSSGVYGGILHYAFVFAIIGSTLLVFLYFWKKDRLDMDEDPKLKMMCDEEDSINGS